MTPLKGINQLGDPHKTPLSKIADVLKRELSFREGIYSVKLVGGALHPTKNWLISIDFYYDTRLQGMLQDSYVFRIWGDGAQTLEWTVDIYQPELDLFPFYCRWHDDKVVVIYEDYFKIYGQTVSPSKLHPLVTLGHHKAVIDVDDDIVTVTHPESAEEQHEITSYQVPDWNQL